MGDPQRRSFRRAPKVGGYRTGEENFRACGYPTKAGGAGMVLLAGQRCLMFPIQGTRLGNSVMTAVSESGATVLWFRDVARKACEVVVSPDSGITKPPTPAWWHADL